jgi:HK97 gp10 family phage protein
MGGFNIEVKGLAEIQRRLDQLKNEDAKRIMNRGLRAGAQVFKAAIEERAPERPNLPSGTALPPGALRRDVTIRTLKGDEKGGIVTVGPGMITNHAAHLVEFGHRQVRGGESTLLKNGKTRGPGKEISQVPAHPYERPAFEAAGNSAMDAVEASLKSDLDRINAKGGS